MNTNIANRNGLLEAKKTWAEIVKSNDTIKSYLNSPNNKCVICKKIYKQKGIV